MAETTNGAFEVRGRVVRDGQGVDGVVVQLKEQDRGRQPTSLGETRTDEAGVFTFSFSQAQAGGRGEGDPEIFVVVVDGGGREIARSTVLTAKADAGTDFGDLPIAATAPSEGVGTSGATPGTTPEATDPNASVGSAREHGTTTREMNVPRSTFYMGPFGRMFRKLPPWIPVGATEAEKVDKIKAIAETMFENDADPSSDNPTIPSAYTYFGQFIDHDITFDPTSSLTKQNDPNRLHNFRTPRFDLDNIYGEGPDDEPFMYERADPSRLLIGKGEGEGEHDLPRNLEGIALLGDKRNDENIIVSQLQLAFLKLHNVVLDRVRSDEGLPGRAAFTRAQEILRFHYQHVVLFDFLPRLCGDIVGKLINFDDPDPDDIKLKFYKPRETSYMPVEFSAAAYRLGHSMIRDTYVLNAKIPTRPIFTPDPDAAPIADLRGFRVLPKEWTLDWARFLDLRAGADVQPSRRIDAKLTSALRVIHPGSASLAELNLIRGFRLGLPSGQAVARAMRKPPLSNAELGLDPAIAGQEAPLWFYILKEAERGGGEHLGDVGARIVAEVFLGLAKADPTCFLNLDPSWSPNTAIAGKPLVEIEGERLQLRDLLRAAGVDKDPFPQPEASPPSW